MKIIKGKLPSAKKVLIYGPEGIGKTTFAASFPNPVFIDTEGSTKEQDVARFEPASSWSMIKEQVRYVAQHPNEFGTLVVDTADWAEKMAIQSVLDEHAKNGIEDFGYGNGYRYVFEKFGELLNLLTDVVDAGVNVVLTAHAALRKFEQPDEMGAYDRYCLKLIDSPKTSIAAAVKEWCDIVLFANYKTIIVTDSKTKKAKAQGGKRVMYTTHHSCWDAKNRYGLAEELPLDYEEIKSIIENRNQTIENTQGFKGIEEEAKENKQETKEISQETKEIKQENKENKQEIKEDKQEGSVDMRVPKALRDLMIHDEISEWDIENFTEAKGFVPFGTKLWDYESINPGIIEGLFVAKWTQIRDMIRQSKKDEVIPFI